VATSGPADHFRDVTEMIYRGREGFAIAHRLTIN